MKRIPQLQPLSKEHHQALVIASRCKKTGVDGNDQQTREYWQQMQRHFSHELEPHFAEEEQFLLPVLQRLGEEDMAQQLCSEHNRLRELIAGDDAVRQRLLEYGVLLASHVRFEERQLFEYLQQRMTTEELEALASARG